MGVSDHQREGAQIISGGEIIAAYAQDTSKISRIVLIKMKINFENIK